jgi:DUF4097 and DUF4098 domain-containing protein YvlB
MASIPPYDPKMAYRQARAQAKAQRAYWRYQTRGCSSSIVRPLVLVGVGVVALLIETGKLPADMFWDWWGHWWPVLLIAIGVLLLIEYFLDRNNPCAGHRGLGGVVGLIVLLAVIGWCSHGFNHWGWQQGDWNTFWGSLGPEFNNDVQLTQTLTVAGGVAPVVNIENPNGDVIVTASTDGQIHLTGHQVAHISSQKRANELFADTKPQIEATVSGANIVVPTRDNLTDDLTIELPPQSSAVIRGDHGDITVEGLKSNADITANRGDVKVQDMGSDVHVQMQHGDFSARNVQGSILMSGRGGDVTLSQVQGGASINGEFFGDTHLEQIGGQVQFRSSRTQITVPHLLGSMTLDSGDLGIQQAAGPITIAAHAKDMDLTGITGGLNIQDNDGDISVTTGLPLGDIRIANHTGDVTLTVPSNASFLFHGATSQDESLQTSFSLPVVSQDGQQTAQGKVGTGGATIDISTTHGSLELNKGDAAVPMAPGSAGQSKAPHFKSKGQVQSALE